MFVRRIWDAWRLLKSLSGEEHHSPSKQESDGTQPKPWGLCLLMSWKERADIRSEQGAVNKQTGKAAGTAPHIQKNVRGPLKELEGLVHVDRSVEEEIQVAFISVCSPKAAAALPVLCYVLRPRCRALHLPLNLEAKDRMHFKVKS